jgi:hypothetical protein
MKKGSGLCTSIPAKNLEAVLSKKEAGKTEPSFLLMENPHLNIWKTNIYHRTRAEIF